MSVGGLLAEDALGATDGTADGATDGAAGGAAERATEGAAEGAIEGATEGATEGAAEGALEATLLAPEVAVLVPRMAGVVGLVSGRPLPTPPAALAYDGAVLDLLSLGPVCGRLGDA